MAIRIHTANAKPRWTFAIGTNTKLYTTFIIIFIIHWFTDSLNQLTFNWMWSASIAYRRTRPIQWGFYFRCATQKQIAKEFFVTLRDIFLNKQQLLFVSLLICFLCLLLLLYFCLCQSHGKMPVSSRRVSRCESILFWFCCAFVVRFGIFFRRSLVFFFFSFFLSLLFCRFYHSPYWRIVYIYTWWAIRTICMCCMCVFECVLCTRMMATAACRILTGAASDGWDPK